MFYWDQPFLVGWVGWVFSCSIRKKPFSVDLVDQLFQPASNLVELVEKAWVATAVIYGDHFKSAAGSYRVAFPQHVKAAKSGNNYSQELLCFNQKQLKKCFIGKPQRLNLNRLRLKRLIPIEHDPRLLMILQRKLCSFKPKKV